MTAKTMRVHRHCGARMVGKSNYCPRCARFVQGDAVDRVRRDGAGKPVHE